MLSFFRIIRFALQDIFRNFSLSVMTILILVLMLLSVNTLLLVQTFTNKTISNVKEQIDVSIYFNYQATPEEIEEMKAYVSAFPEVVETTFLDQEAVLEIFKETHKDNPAIIASLEELETNPLGPTLVIKTRETGDYKNIIEALSVPEYENIVEAKTFGDTEKAIERVTVITAQIERGVIALSLLFGIIAFFVIFNTVRVAIYTQRTEIGIKKLVGATNWFVRGPYIIEAFLFSLISVAIAGVIIATAIAYLDPFIGVILSESKFLTNYVSSNILVLAGGQFVAVLLLNITTSGLAMRKYLKT